METVAVTCPDGQWTQVGTNIKSILLRMRTTGSVKVHAGSAQPAADTANYLTISNVTGPVGIDYSAAFSVWVMPEGADDEVLEVLRGA